MILNILFQMVKDLGQFKKIHVDFLQLYFIPQK